MLLFSFGETALNINKTAVVNLSALAVVVISFFTAPAFKEMLFYTGLFALSGSLTNQLAIYMLFEKVPFLYGSGVIEARFETFKESVRELMMREFFSHAQIEEFLKNEEKKIDLAPIIEQTDFSTAFDALSKSVMESPLGGMLSMFGGEKALEGLRSPFGAKIKSTLIHIVQSESFEYTLKKHLENSSLSDDMIKNIERIIQIRLDELTPRTLKEIIERLIREHLSWLIVWGGIFGALIGLLGSFLSKVV